MITHGLLGEVHDASIHCRESATARCRYAVLLPHGVPVEVREGVEPSERTGRRDEMEAVRHYPAVSH